MPLTLRRRFGALFDFWWFEALVSLRLSVTLRVFKALGILLGLVGLLVSLTVVLVALTVIRSITADDAKYSDGLVAFATIISAWHLCVSWGQESLTQRRFVVSKAANAPLFRALDIRARDFLLVYRGIPIIGSGSRTFLLVLLALIYAHQARPVSVLSWTGALLLVVLGVTLALARSVRNALGTNAREGEQAWAVCLALAVTLGLGIWAGQLATAWTGGTPSNIVRISDLTATGITVVAALAIAFTLRNARRDIRRLESQSFPVGTPAKPDRPTLAFAGPRRIGPAGPIDHAVAIARHGLGTWQYDAAGRVLLVAALTVSFIGGLRAGGFDPTHAFSGDLDQQTGLLGLYLSVIMAVSLVDLVLSVVGPTRLAYNLRLFWELGAPVLHLALGQFVIAVLPGAVSGAAMALAMTFLGVNHAAGCLALGLCVAAGAVVADALAISPRNADGTGTMPAVNTLVTLLLALPVLLATAMTDSWIAAVAVTIYTALLLLGAFLCARNRISTHPSSSKMLKQAMTSAPPSSIALT